MTHKACQLLNEMILRDIPNAHRRCLYDGAMADDSAMAFDDAMADDTAMAANPAPTR